MRVLDLISIFAFYNSPPILQSTNMAELKYPVAMQSFPEIRERGFVYVDKSQYIPMLMDRGKYFFLARPRRFGKSLFLSMLQAYFEGRRELFEGLAAADFDHDWEPRAVLHIDFTAQNYTVEEGLDQVINDILAGWESIYGVPQTGGTSAIRFKNIIASAYEQTGRKVVILIDEYDKPLVDTIDYPDLQENFRNQLRGLYGNLKKMDSCIEFAFLTGITRFGRLNIFSDLNNLNDISMDSEFSGICGITSEELRHYFDSGVRLFARSENCSVEEMYDTLRVNYDGYHFSPQESPDIYNPFSLLTSLQKRFIDEYWFSTGTPFFLFKRIKNGSLAIEKYSKMRVLKPRIEQVPFNMEGDPAPILYQTGYLTIKGYDPRSGFITLGFPNREVEKGFLSGLLEVYTSHSRSATSFSVPDFMEDIEEGNPGQFMLRLQSLFSDISYDSFDLMALEQHYRNVVYLLFKLLGYYCHSEYRTSNGRIDLILGTDRYLYLFEFKLDKSPREALDQINRKDYLLPFRFDGRKAFKIGADFSTVKKNLDSWIVEPVDQN